MVVLQFFSSVWYAHKLILESAPKHLLSLDGRKRDILVLVAPAVKGTSPGLKAGVDLKVFAKLPLDDGEGGAPPTLQVLLGMVGRLCEAISCFKSFCLFY